MPREASGGLARDHWLPLGSGFEHGLPVVLSHVVFAGVDPYRVVHDAVEDCVGDGVAAEPVVGGVFAHELGHAARLVRRHADLFGEVGHADVDRAVACPARGFRQRA